MKLAAVVVWYNPSDKEKNNIHSYLEYVDKLYVIDNSDYISHLSDEKIEYVFNNDNLGIAKALNLGATKAIKDGFEWLLTMDQDTIFQNDDIDCIKDYISHNDMASIGIVSPWHNTRLHIKKPSSSIDYPLDVMTSGNFLNLNIYQSIGGFRDDLFIDGVDIEYCLRLKRNHYKVLRLNDYEIIHNLGDIKYKYLFKKELLCLNHNYLRVYYKVRNYLYINKMYKDLEPEFCNKLIKLKQMIWCIIFYEKDKFKKIRSIIYAKSDFKKGLFGKYNH